MTDNPYSDPVNEGATPEPKRSKSQLIKWLALGGIVVLLVCLFLPDGRNVREAARRTHCKNNLKQIGKALYAYESRYGALPPAHTVDAEGKPLHGWRTLILPFLDQEQLYETVDLSKPWNDPANVTAYETKIPVFRCPSVSTGLQNYTTYMAIVASNGCFHSERPRYLSEITDSHSETLMLIEVAPEHAVHWMSPLDASEPLVKGFSSESKLAHRGGTHVLMVDGTCRFVSENLSAAKRHALISISENDDAGEF